MQKIHKFQEEKLKKILWVKKNPEKNEKNLLKIVDKYIPYISYIPWIECVCICNSLAMNACHKDSDIDLFVITQKNRLWTARIFLTLFLSLIWKRKTSQQHAWKFCLSFFISKEDMSLKKIALKDDIYLIYWLKTIIPVINRNNSFEDFIHKNQDWCEINNPHPQKIIEPQMLKTPKLLTSCWDYCEKLLKSIFSPQTKKSFQELWKPFWVVISDTMLKFHDRDKRKEIKYLVV